jgi:hypothetical protein
MAGDGGLNPDDALIAIHSAVFWLSVVFVIPPILIWKVARGANIKWSTVMLTIMGCLVFLMYILVCLIQSTWDVAINSTRPWSEMMNGRVAALRKLVADRNAELAEIRRMYVARDKLIGLALANLTIIVAQTPPPAVPGAPTPALDF